MKAEEVAIETLIVIVDPLYYLFWGCLWGAVGLGLTAVTLVVLTIREGEPREKK